MADSEQVPLESNVSAGDIGQDVADEMRRLSETRSAVSSPAPPLFDPAAAYGIVPPQGFPSLSGEIGEFSSPDDRIQVPTIGRSAKTLEDLYESYPKIGDGAHFIRIERKKPEIWDNVRISGYLGDLHEQIGMHDFAEKYGGGEYLVTVRGPVRASLDSDGHVKTRSLESVTLKFPGVPKRAAQDYAGDDMQRMGVSGPMNQMVIEQMRSQQEEKRRAEQRAEEMQRQMLGLTGRGIDPGIMAALTQASEKRADEAKSAQAETISELRRQNLRKDEIIEQKDTEVQRLRQQVVDIQRDATVKMREEESKQVRELKEFHEKENARIKEDHARTIERISEEHRRSMKEMADRQADDRNKTERDYSQERERSRDDVSRREATLKSDYDRQIQMLTQAYESRLADSARQNEREIASVRDQRDREISNMREIMESRTRTAESTSSMRVGLLETEILRARSELDGLKRENEDLRARTYKDPIQAVMEAHDLAQKTGFGGGAQPEEEFDWKKGAFQAVQGIVGKVPEIMKGLEEARQHNRAAASGAPMQAGYQPQQLPPGAQQQQAMQQQHRAQQAQQAQQRRSYAQPPPGVAFIPTPEWQRGPHGAMAPGDAPPLPPQVFGPPRENPAPKPMYIGQTPPPKQAPAPISGQQAIGEPSGDIGFVDHSKPPQRQAQQEQQVQQEEQVQQQSVNVGGTELTEEQVMQFVGQLDEAIMSGVIPPEAFAQGFLQKVGPDAARAVISGLSPDMLVDGIAANPAAAKTAIITREGRDYVQRLWYEVAKLC